MCIETSPPASSKISLLAAGGTLVAAAPVVTLRISVCEHRVPFVRSLFPGGIFRRFTESEAPSGAIHFPRKIA